MNIACLSGKGGAGKTFVAVNLAAAAGRSTYIDCDVEEPNGRLFLKPQSVTAETVTTPLPQFSKDLCTGCKACVAFCHFNALVYIREIPMLFPEVCHSCGGCQLVCPHGAVSQVEKPVGRVELGHHGEMHVVTGVLNPGEASGVPVIRQALRHCSGLTLLDCPPGSACSVMEAIMDADYCVLVAEPTAFGFHNVAMVHQLATLLGKPCGVVINKETTPYLPLEDFCNQHHLPILAHIPHDPLLGEIIARGGIVVEELPQERQRFQGILAEIGGSS